MLVLLRSHLQNSLSLTVEPNGTVQQLSDLVSNRLEISNQKFSLYHGGIQLQNNLLLCEYDLEDCSYVDVNCDLLGGGKKRKKKTYTTPKKIKHKRKKVDSNGKVTRLRRECPTETCGSGVFMASHFDRQYCGKCALTYMQANK